MTTLSRSLIMSLMVVMLSGLLGGLSRVIGLPVADFLRINHGPILCAVVFPGLIGLERAVAIGRGWAWVPTLSAFLSLLGMFVVGRAAFPILGMTAAGLLLQQMFLWKRRPGLDGQIAAVAPICLWLADWRWGGGDPAPLCALGWSSFLIMVIAAERLELSFLYRSASYVMPGATLLTLGGVALQQPRLVGLGWLALALWLSAHDLARRNAGRSGLVAYTARSVLLGYAWLATSGLQLLVYGLPCLSGSGFDRVLHGVFVGFALSMVMAHGPILFPALLKCSMVFSNGFYLPLVLLHSSLLMRCFGPWAKWGASGNMLAVFVFGLTMVAHSRSGGKPWLTPTGG
ncbi:hypothetical protein IV102_17305 [bacterium]|nr:hypothetical protein [bacterium]